jgi:UDP-N-acetylglucosamine 4,6-dehydratase
MCPVDDSHLTLEFDDHFVIKPTIMFVAKHDYEKNKIGEIGKAVKQGFEYSSNLNDKWLTKDELMAML